MPRDAFDKAVGADDMEPFLFPGMGPVRTCRAPEQVGRAVEKLGKSFLGRVA